MSDVLSVMLIGMAPSFAGHMAMDFGRVAIVARRRIAAGVFQGQSFGTGEEFFGFSLCRHRNERDVPVR